MIFLRDENFQKSFLDDRGKYNEKEQALRSQ